MHFKWPQIIITALIVIQFTLGLIKESEQKQERSKFISGIIAAFIYYGAFILLLYWGGFYQW